jgi:hypothetical protein
MHNCPFDRMNYLYWQIFVAETCSAAHSLAEQNMRPEAVLNRCAPGIRRKSLTESFPRAVCMRFDGPPAGVAAAAAVTGGRAAQSPARRAPANESGSSRRTLGRPGAAFPYTMSATVYAVDIDSGS